MYDFNIKTFIFQDKNIEIDGYEEEILNDKRVHTIFCHSVDPIKPISCEKCGGVEFKIKDYYYRTIKHNILMRNEPITLKYKQTRFICQYCKKTVNEVISIVNKGSRLSKELINEIILSCNKGRTVLDVSESTNVTTSTVNNVYDKVTTVPRNELTELICIDEFKAPVKEGKLAFVIVDGYTGNTIDVLPSRRQEYLYSYFRKISKKERERVKYIVTDLCSVYLNVIKDCFPKAIHIADRFHWIRIMTKEVNNIRIDAMKFRLNVANRETENGKKFPLKYNENYRLAKTMKKYYGLVLFNTKNGDQNYLKVENHVYGNVKQKYKNYEILEYMINNDEDLEEAYYLLQELYFIAYRVTYEEVRTKLYEWMKKVKESNKKIWRMKSAVRTYEEWYKQIINSFIINEELGSYMTNGVAEARNNISKTIIRMGYGMTSFKNLRAKILEQEKIRRQRKEEKIIKRIK